MACISRGESSDVCTNCCWNGEYRVESASPKSFQMLKAAASAVSLCLSYFRVEVASTVQFFDGNELTPNIERIVYSNSEVIMVKPPLCVRLFPARPPKDSGAAKGQKNHLRKPAGIKPLSFYEQQRLWRAVSCSSAPNSEVFG